MSSIPCRCIWWAPLPWPVPGSSSASAFQSWHCWTQVRCKGMVSGVSNRSAKKYSCEACYGYVQLVLKTKLVHNLANLLQFSLRRRTRQNSCVNFWFWKHSLKMFCFTQENFVKGLQNSWEDFVWTNNRPGLGNIAVFVTVYAKVWNTVYLYYTSQKHSAN